MSFRWVWAFVDRPVERFAETAVFWAAVTGSVVSPLRGEREEFATLLPPEADGSVKLQAVTGRGGIHLDLDVDDVALDRGRAVGLGAEVVAEHQYYSVLRSPGGQIFCLTTWEGAKNHAGVLVQPDGARSRLDQIALDFAPAEHESATRFWREFTGWSVRPGRRPEFEVLTSDDSPFRLLLQRLDAGESGAHLDFACSDREATRAWHESLGAEFVARHSGWIVMRDPAGEPYCLTGRNPETGIVE